MPITEQQLLHILTNAGRQAGVFVPVLNAAMGKYGIVTKLRIAAFIAQVRHESGQLRYVRGDLGANRATGRLRRSSRPGQHGEGGRFQVPWPWVDPGHRPGELLGVR